MKKLLIILIVIFAPLWVLAGNGLPDLPGGFVLEEYVTDFLTWIVTVIFLTSLINRLPWFKFEDQNKRFLSWAVMLISGAVSYYFAWGIFDTSIIIAAVYVIAGALGSHFGYHTIKEVLKDFGLLKG